MSYIFGRILIISIIIYSQEELNEEFSYQPEIYLHVINGSGNQLTLFSLQKTSISYCFENTGPGMSAVFIQCDNCPCNWSNCDGGQKTILGNTEPLQNSGGYSICYEGINLTHYTYGYGLYKLNINGGLCYCYLDFRDIRYGGTSMGNTFGPDVRMVYDYNINKLKIKPSDNIYNNNFDTLDMGEHVKIWNYYGYSQSLTDSFPDYWQNSMALIDNDYHPKLIWSTNSGSQSETSYKI